MKPRITFGEWHCDAIVGYEQHQRVIRIARFLEGLHYFAKRIVQTPGRIQVGC